MTTCMRYFLGVVGVGCLLLLTACGSSEQTSFTDRWAAFVHIDGQHILTVPGVSYTVAVHSSSDGLQLSGTISGTTYTKNQQELTTLAFDRTMQDSFTDKQSRSAVVTRYWTSNRILLRPDAGTINGTSQEITLFRSLLEKARGIWISFDPTIDDMGLVTMPLPVAPLLTLSPTALLDTAMMKTGTIKKTIQPGPLSLVPSLFSSKKTTTDISWSQFSAASLDHTIGAITQLLHNSSGDILPRMTGRVVELDDDIEQITTTVQLPRAWWTCHLLWTETMQTGSCTDGSWRINRDTERAGTATTLTIQTPQDTVQFVGDVDRSPAGLSLMGTVTITSPWVLVVPLVLSFDMVVHPAADLTVWQEAPTTGFVSFRELLQ